MNMLGGQTRLYLITQSLINPKHSPMLCSSENWVIYQAKIEGIPAVVSEYSDLSKGQSWTEIGLTMSHKGKEYYPHHIRWIIDAYDKFVRELTKGEKGKGSCWHKQTRGVGLSQSRKHSFVDADVYVAKLAALYCIFLQLIGDTKPDIVDIQAEVTLKWQ